MKRTGDAATAGSQGGRGVVGSGGAGQGSRASGGRGQVEESNAGNGDGGDGQHKGTPRNASEEAASATIDSAEALIVPKGGGDVGNDHAHACPEQNDGESREAFCEEEVDKEPKAKSDVGVIGPGHFVEEMIEDGALP